MCSSLSDVASHFFMLFNIVVLLYVMFYCVITLGLWLQYIRKYDLCSRLQSKTVVDCNFLSLYIQTNIQDKLKWSDFERTTQLGSKLHLNLPSEVSGTQHHQSSFTFVYFARNLPVFYPYVKCSLPGVYPESTTSFPGVYQEFTTT